MNINLFEEEEKKRVDLREKSKEEDYREEHYHSWRFDSLELFLLSIFLALHISHLIITNTEPPLFNLFTYSWQQQNRDL